ncbi:MAG TPA: hypothetical protein VEY11_00370 [Pyrinomonadaceae bacterium]|nr:hypothetical protein [Pyrinomonadaceae bacterium]
MRITTRIIAALLIVLFFAQSSFSQSIYENACTCDASTKLEKFVKESSAEVEQIGPALFKNFGSGNWGVARLTGQKINGLRADGASDPNHPLDAYFITYATNHKSRFHYSLLAHQYGDVKKPLVDYSKFEELKSYSNFEAVRKDIAAKKFLLAVHSGDAIPPADIAPANIIFTDPSFIGLRDYDRFKKINEQFDESLPAKSRKGLSFERVLFITSAKEKNGAEVITIYERQFIKGNDHQHHLVGHAYITGVGNPKAEEALTRELQSLGRGGRVYLYGDEIKNLNIEELADGFGVDLIRRSPDTIKNFAITESQLNTIENREFKKETTVLLNGTPSSREELISIGSPLYGLEGWIEDKERVERTTQDKYHRRIENKQELLQELQYGDNDVILIVAHSDGVSIYFRGERVSVAELKALPARQHFRFRERLAVLISCNTGISGKRNWLNGKETKAFAEVLVEKRFVEAVIAPDHEISVDDGIRALAAILQGRPLSAIRSSRGWRKFAQIKIYTRKSRV